MKTRFAIILCVFNAAALAAGYLYFSEYWGNQVQQDQQSAQQEVAAWKAKAEEVNTLYPQTVVVRTNAFNWSQLESTDYRQYIANLRAIGCPETTLRDIIMTDVMRLYAQRRGQYSQNGRPFRYWETDEKRTLKQSQLQEREKQLALIDKELPAVLRELLGVNYEREMKKYFVDTDEDNQRLGFLSDAKRAQVLALRDKFEGEREALSYPAADGTVPTPDPEKLKEIDKEQEAALADLLTADEKEEYELSTSSTSDFLRKELVGFNPTENEFKEVFRRQKAIDDEYAYQDMSDETVRAKKAADEQDMMANVESQLSPARAAALEKAKDPDYQSVTLLAERYDLPEETSQAIVDMRRAAESEKQQLLADKDIPADRVEIALKAIESETERAAKETLGAQAYAQYSQNAAWIRNLGGN